MKSELQEKFGAFFEPELIREIEHAGKPLSVKAGETIIETGQVIRSIPLILSGSIKVVRVDESGRELLLYYVNPQESCAMSFTCCMQHYPSEIRAVAEEDTEILMIPASVMDEWLVKYSSWKNFVMKTIRIRFNEMLKMIDQVTFQNLDERLLNYLREKSKTGGSPLLNISHQQIADELASSRVVISRLLKKLEDEGVLLLYRNQIKLLREL